MNKKNKFKWKYGNKTCRKKFDRKPKKNSKKQFCKKEYKTITMGNK